MNFLAHLFLSDENPEIMVGNFIADMVKGNSFLGYPTTIGKGIRIHRNIDKFTDSHPIVQLSKKRLRPNYRKYAGVIVDMFYDHLLAVDWHTYSPIPLASFAEKAYKEKAGSEDVQSEQSDVSENSKNEGDVVDADFEEVKDGDAKK